MQVSRMLSAARYAPFLVTTAAALAFAHPALAEEPAHGTPIEASGHEGAGHEGAAHEGAAHEGEHHVSYTNDDDHDGTANWMDADSDGYVIKGLGVHAGNLLLFLVVVGLLARRPLGDALGNREVVIRKSISEAAEAHAAAQAKAEEVSRRLDALDAEIAKMKSDARAQIADEEKKLVARAQEEAARIVETADRNVREELTRARLALRKDTVDLAVKAAEDTLKKQFHPSDQRRLARSFLDTLGEARG